MSSAPSSRSRDSDQVEQIQPSDWVAEVRAARERGYGWFDSISAVDEIGRPDEQGREQVRVMVRLESVNGRGLRLEVCVPRDEPRLDSLADVFAGASWHEREVHDFFGVVFVGGDDRPLLWHQVPGTPVLRPLLKDAVLAARSVREWPGLSAEERGARRAIPIGVPDPQLWGDRDPEQGPPSPAEVAAEVGGAQRTRRVPRDVP